MSSVTIDGLEVTAAPDPVTRGYVFSPTMLYLQGRRFTPALQNVVVSYTAKARAKKENENV